jgi:membrane fusion protein, heavy metal efflux system
MKTFQIIRLMLLAAFLAGCHRRTSQEETPQPTVAGDKITFATNAPQLGYLAVETAQQKKASATGLYGRLAWDDDVTVRVFSPVAGRVAGISPEVNQPVKKGDVLATLESPDYGQMQSDAQKAASDLVLSDRTLARERDLLQHGAAAQKDVESAEADYARAKSENERTTAQLQAVSLGRPDSAPATFDLRSPLDGIVVEKNITPGQQIRSDQILANAPQFVNPLFVVTDPTRLWLYLDVTEMDVAALSPRQEVAIHSKAFPGKIFHGQLEIIGGGLDATTRMVKARCRVDNSEKLLRAEMYVSADVEAAMTSGVEVPTQAVFLKENAHYLFTENEPGRFERRPVKLGMETGGRSVVLEGLSAGQKVVTDGCLLLEAILEGQSL